MVFYVKHNNPLIIKDDDFSKMTTRDKERIIKVLENELKKSDSQSFLNLESVVYADAIKLLKGEVKLENISEDIPEIIRSIAEDLGYDSIISVKKGGNDIAIFKPNLIKSSNEETRNDNGEIIPLSKRFDINNDDVRY